MSSKKSGLGRGLTDLGLKEILGNVDTATVEPGVDQIKKIDVRDIDHIVFGGMGGSSTSAQMSRDSD